MKKNSEAVCEMLEEQERKLLKKGDLDEHDLHILKMLSSVVTDYKTREVMEREEMKGGFSQHYPPNMWMDRMNTYDNSMGMSNEGNSREGGSFRRGRDARTGRYESRDGGSYEGSYEGSYDGSYDGSYGNSYGRYSREEAEDQFKGKLRKLMNEAPNEEAKESIRQMINSMR